MLQRAQTRGRAAEVGHGEGTVLRERKAKPQETELGEGEQKKRLITDQSWPPETGFRTGLMIPPPPGSHLEQKRQPN